MVDAEDADLAVAEAKARKMLDDCAAQRQALVNRRAEIDAAEIAQGKLIQAPVGVSEESVSAGKAVALTFEIGPLHRTPAPSLTAAVTLEGTDTEKQRRTRIGPQRYLMLATIRDAGPFSASEIATLTNLSPRRIKDQMWSDKKEGIVWEVDDGSGSGVMKYSLTEEGAAFIAKFEERCKKLGKSLPTAADFVDRDEDDAPEQIMEDEAQE